MLEQAGHLNGIIRWFKFILGVCICVQCIFVEVLI